MEQQLYELLQECTMRVTVPGKAGHGTGFFVAPGLILTCAHLFTAALSTPSSVEVYLRGQPHPAQITKIQREHDLALLQVSLIDHPCVYLHGGVVPFDPLYSYGYPDDHPDGDPATFSLEGKAGAQGEQLKFKTGQVRPGMSGAPLLNVRTGQVCGIVQLTRDRNNDLGGRAIPTTAVFQVFPELVAQQQHFHRQDRRWTNCLWEVNARTKYLEGIIRRYSSLTLPIGPAQGFSLQAIFQPLKLRRDPLAAEDLMFDERRELLGEPRYSDEDPRRVTPHSRQSHRHAQELPVVLAENGDDALKKSSTHSMVILGGPGTGKTTLLKYLVSNRAQKALADPIAPLPIFITLPDLARSGKTLKEYLTSVVQDMMVDERYAQELWRSLEQGQAFMCLDSLDEVPPKVRPEEIRLINEWTSSTNSIYIIGSRFTDYKGGLLRSDQFTEWELQPMTLSLRQELAKRLLPELYRLMHPGETIAENSISTFMITLAQHEQAVAWGENPLLFSLAAVVYVHTGTLPSIRTMLYQWVIEAVLETREPVRFRREMLFSVLACLALELYQEKGRTFTRKDILRLLRIVRKQQDERWDTEEIAERIINSGILEVVAYDTYGFRHQTFQEYLAAVELAQQLVNRDQATQEEGWALAWSKRTYSRWIEVLRLMVGVLVQNHGRQGVQRATGWLSMLVRQRKQPEGDPGDLGLTLALQSLGEIAVKQTRYWQEVGGTALEWEVAEAWMEQLFDAARQGREKQQERLRSVGQELHRLSISTLKEIEAHLENALSDYDSQVKVEAAHALGRLGEHVPLDILIAALDHEDEDVRVAVLEALGRMGDRAPTALLIRSLEEESLFIRQAAARALGELGENTPAEPLVRALGDWNVNGRNAAIEALRKMGERIPIELLMEALNESHNGLLVRGVLEAMETLGIPIPQAPVLRALDVIEETEIRAALIGALGAMKEQAPIELLMRFWDDEDEWIRSAAVAALGQLGERIAVEKLMSALEDTSWMVRSNALVALEGLGESIPVEPFVNALKDSDVQVSMRAAEVLGRRGIKTSVGPLMDALRSDDSYLRYTAAEALGAIATGVPIEPLINALDDSSLLVFGSAAWALGEVGERVAVEQLLTSLANHTYRICEASVQVLGVLGKDPPMDWLLTNLSDSRWETRAIAVQELEDLGEHLPMKLLLAALNDKEGFVRTEAVHVMGTLGERAQIMPLLTALGDEYGDVREAAVEALGNFKERIPVEPLLTILDNSNPSIRREAIQVVGMLAERAPIEPLVAALDAEDRGVRAAAVEALGRLGKHAPRELLVAALKDQDEDVRAAAVAALGRIREHVPIETFANALQDTSWKVREAAVGVLGRLGKHAPRELLVAALKDQDEDVRAAAVAALGKFYKEESVEFLVEALKDKNDRVRAAAVLALGERTSLEQLIAALNNRESEVRVAAVKVLKWRGEDAPIELLVAALGDWHTEVRVTVVQALGQFGEHAPIELLVAALGDSDREVRRAAIEALQHLDSSAISTVEREAISVLEGRGPGRILGSLAQGFIADAVGRMGRASPTMLEHLTQLLDWNYWEVQVEAAMALGKLQRNIPDGTIRRLLKLRCNSPSRAVREEVDEALAEILSLETSIEDD
jgi:HEAT repeat protein